MPRHVPDACPACGGSGIPTELGSFFRVPRDVPLAAVLQNKASRSVVVALRLNWLRFFERPRGWRRMAILQNKANRSVATALWLNGFVFFECPHHATRAAVHKPPAGLPARCLLSGRGADPECNQPHRTTPAFLQNKANRLPGRIARLPRIRLNAAAGLPS